MSYLKELTIENLIKLRDHHRAVYNTYCNMVSMQGGWMMWDGDKQDAAERQVREINNELAIRESKPKQ